MVLITKTYLVTVFGTHGIGENPISPFDVVDDPSFLSLEAWNQFDDQQPRLYLNYLLYDNDFNLVDFGFDQVSEAARIPADTALLAGHAFEKLMLELVTEQAGFVYIYVSNENDQNVTAYFDDLGVEHTYGNIAVATDFYPFGLAVAGRELERIKWRYGYQGEFTEKDEETGWNSFELRMYDPVVGRWLSVDPAGQFWSPYLGMGNSPVNQIDPDGAYSKFGAWWRSGFRSSRIYESGGEWGFNKGTGEYTWDVWQREGMEDIHIRREITEFKVGQFGEGSTIPLLTTYQPNVMGRVKSFIENSPGPISFFGGIGYEMADNAYISFFQMGGDRSNLEGFSVNNNEINDAGVNTLMTLNPIGRTSTSLFKGVNISSFNKYFKGSFVARLQPQLKGYVLRQYNKWIHKGRIGTFSTATGAGAKVTDSILNE